LDIFKGVVEFKLLPFESAHLMEGQNVDSLHVSQVGGKPCNLGNVLTSIRKSRNEYEAYPDWYSVSRQSAGEIQDGANLHASKPAVKFWLPAFEIEQHEINVLQVRIRKPRPKSTVGI
jgi:hypothetical protein